MKIAVLGGGNGAYAAAADLTEKGHEVRLWRRDAAALRRSSVLTLKDASGQRDVSIHALCVEIGEAVRGAEVVLNDLSPSIILPAGTYAEWSAIFQNVVLNAVHAMLDERASKEPESTHRYRSLRFRILEHTHRQTI